MSSASRPYLLDVTRLVARSWSARRSTGIDRVCYAYFDRFRTRALAVVQYSGVIRVLTAEDSDALFALLLGPDKHFRARLLRFAPMAFARASTRNAAPGAIYLNASHTDFDLAGHVRWAREGEIRPVYFLHDLIPITHAPLCRPLASRRHSRRVTSALKNAAGIIVNSHWTAGELGCFADEKRLPFPPVLAAPLAGADLTSLVEQEPAAEDHFVCVGSIEPRKNHQLLLDVWRKLYERLGSAAPRLVIVGQWGRGSVGIRRQLRDDPRLRAHVEVRSDCSDAEMAQAMSSARAVLLPSLAEGFGLPLIEALHLKTPVISSNLHSFREFGKGIPLMLRPDDAHAWESAIIDFSNHSPERERQLGLLSSFRAASWHDHFTDVESWLSGLTHLHRVESKDTQVQCLPA